MKKILLLLSCAALFACTSDEMDGPNNDQRGQTTPGESNSQTLVKGPVSVTFGELTSSTAAFSSTLDIANIDEYKEVGLLYSRHSEFDIETDGVTKVQITKENFEEELTGLRWNSTYYYTIYLQRHNGIYQYGDIRLFKTKDITVSLSVTNITTTGAILFGNVSITGPLNVVEIGLQYSKSKDFSSGVVSTKIPVAYYDNFSINVSSLAPGETYYYCSYIKVNGVYGYGEIKSFTTLQHPYNVQSDLNMSASTDLSSSATANSYIVSKGGLYKIKAVKGNSTTSVGSVASALILWETFGTSTTPNHCELIKGVCYKDGYIGFQTADTFKEGNAVIAAKDASGAILWSWHIWFTDQPQGQTYYNNAGTMMDRNLGATSATPGDVGALGLLYQWGRKDPFLGSSSISDNVIAKSTITWPSSVSSNSSNGTIAYATANPTTFIKYNSNNYDWYYTGSSSTDNTRWTTSSSAKSIYDPCPASWRVPDGGSNGVWSKALGSSSSFTISSLYSNSNEGINFSGKFGSASTIWYPASGSRYGSDGSLNNVGDGGYSWSASPSRYYAYYLRFNFFGDVSPSYNGDRAGGLSVRCLQE